MTSPRQKKAILLLSGGLDSSLALHLLLDQGIKLVAVNFRSPFCLCDSRAGGCGSAGKLAQRLGVQWIHRFLGKEYLEIVRAPRHGYGSNMNPCIDCRILMMRKTKELMAEVGASFIATGEVLGQRPMSQHRRALRLIERQSGLEGLILRPLSAQLFPPTIPEANGWVDRSRLLSISGRSRKQQFALADKFALRDYPCPAGGCLLTDPAFARKVRDLAAHHQLTLGEVSLLRFGRHFRLSPDSKLIVGRNETENGALEKYAPTCAATIEPLNAPGPLALFKGVWDEAQLPVAAGLVARYSDHEPDTPVELSIRRPGASEQATMQAFPLNRELIESLRI